MSPHISLAENLMMSNEKREAQTNCISQDKYVSCVHTSDVPITVI